MDIIIKNEILNIYCIIFYFNIGCTEHTELYNDDWYLYCKIAKTQEDNERKLKF